MMTRVAVVLGGAVLSAAIAPPAAAGGWAESSLGKAQFGEVWNGQSFTASDLAGRVVLIHVWSDGSPDCRKAMPGLAAFEGTMRGSGLMVLGVARRSTKEAAMEVASQSRVDFPIIDGGTLPGTDEEKIPQYVVFDHVGEIVFKQIETADTQDGLSSACRAAIEKALTRAGPVLAVAVEEFQEKEIIKLAKRANKGGGLGKLLSELDARIAGGSEAEKNEGERLRDQIIAYGERVMADAEAVREGRPHRHYDMLKDLAKDFRGHDLGAKAESVVQSIKKDKAAMREVESSRLYEEMSLASEKDRKRIYGTLKKKYAQTRFAQRAASEMGEDLPPKDDNGVKKEAEQDSDDEEDD